MCLSKRKKFRRPIIHITFTLCFGVLLLPSLNAQTSFQKLDHIWDQLRLGDRDSAAIGLSSLHASDTLEAPAYARYATIQGLLHYWSGESKAALHYLDTAIVLTTHQSDTLWQIRSLEILGNLHRSQRLLDHSLRYYLRAVSLAQSGGYHDLLLNLGNDLGIVARRLGNYDDAQQYLEQVLKEIDSLQQLPENDPQRDGRILARTYHNLALVYEAQQDFFNAFRFHRRSIALNRENHQPRALCASLVNLSESYAELDSLSKAVETAREALDLALMEGYAQYEAIIRINLAGYHWRQHQTDQVTLHLAQAEKLAASLDLTEVMVEVLRLKYELLRSKNEPQLALTAFQRYVSLKDSVSEGERALAANQRLQSFSFREQVVADSLSHVAQAREQELRIAGQEASLERDKAIRWGLIIGIGLLMSLIWVVFRNFREQHLARLRLGRAKARSDELLLNILPAETAEELKTYGRAASRRYDEASVLFTDFKGFTMLSEVLSPEELVAEIDHCFRAFDAIVTRHGVEKIKTIGDAYMAVSGLPVEDQDHARKLVEVALDIQEFMLAYAEKRKSEHKPFFEIRIGVHSGPLLAGVVGSRKFAYDVWGDTVNTASRMESSGEPGQVNVSEQTRIRTEGSYRFVSRGKVAAKNKGNLEMYFVERLVGESVQAL